MIRAATPEDARAIAELFRRSFRTLTFLPELHTPEEDLAFFAGVVDEHEVWVWDEGGRILGFAALSGSELTQLYVEPDAHRRGIGTALLVHAQARRADGLELWVFQQNEAARRLYERHGFTLVRETDGSGNEERTPDALYAWPGAPGSGARRVSSAAPSSTPARPSPEGPASAPASSS